MREVDKRRRLRVGLFTVGLLILFAVSILLLGEKQQLFVRQVRFITRFQHVGGLTPGAAVWLNGVVAGSVEEVDLPADPQEQKITVRFRVDAKLSRRVRADSAVRIRTLGLLGDRYLEITSGSPRQPRLQAGDEVPGVEPTDVAAVLSQGGDVVANVLAISGSLRTILERVEKGEGALGEITTNPEKGTKAVMHLVSMLEQTDELLKGIRQGRGVVGKLLTDSALEQRLIDDLGGMAHAGREVAEALERDLKREDSMVAALLRDPDGRRRLQGVLDNVGEAAAAAAKAGGELVQGKGTLGRLVADEKYADDFLGDLAALTAAMRSVAVKLDRGEGTAGRFVNDPALWDDLENVVRGVRSSRLVTWFVRNRRQAGERSAGAEATPAAGGR
jgi:phospholipid/cholesterol/gamma-HCH transport system substrate-binding protein